MKPADVRVLCDHSEGHDGARHVWIIGDDGGRMFQVEFFGDDRALQDAVGQMMMAAAEAGYPVETLG